MKSNKKVLNDERVVKESNQIYKICFYVLWTFIFIDVLIKFNLYTFDESPSYMWYLFGVEALFLVVIFYFYIIANASKGILIGASNLEINKFPLKRYLLISVILSLILSIGLFVIRYIVSNIKGLVGDGGEYWIGFFTLLTFVLAFITLFSSFYLCYSIVTKVNKKMEEQL